MAQVTSFMVKMTFKRMRYQPTDGPTEWDIESLHATNNSVVSEESHGLFIIFLSTFISYRFWNSKCLSFITNENMGKKYPVIGAFHSVEGVQIVYH